MLFRSASTPVDIILLDVQVGPEYGLDLLPAIRLMNPAPKTIIMTAYGEVEMAVDAMKNGAYDFLSKPVNFSLLEATIKKENQATTEIARNLRDSAPALPLAALKARRCAVLCRGF